MHHTLLAAALASCATTSPPVDTLVAQSREANDALMRGDSERYGALVHHAADFTLFSPFGGTPSRGVPDRARLGRFFRNGTLKQELVEAYSSPDMIALAVIERAHVEVGGLPAQDWALRVTLIYRRTGAEWQLVHRHADPLANGISLAQAAALAK